MLAEVRAVVASKQGLSCDGYFRLSARTAHLRERLYVSVADGDKVFLPQDPYEHFPVSEIEEYYLKRLRLGLNQSIGAGGGEVLFSCEGPAADEGATVIEITLAGLEPTLNEPLLFRWIAAIPEKYKHFAALRRSLRAPYRPDVLPARAFVPAAREPARPRRPTAQAVFEEKKREQLRRWGVLEDYDRMKARRGG